MNPDALNATELAIETERCRRSAHFFIFDCRKLLTRDEQELVVPPRPFPLDDPYLRVMLDMLLVSGHCIQPDQAHYAREYGYYHDFLAHLYELGLCFVEKSRELMATWICLAYLHWRAKYHPNQLILVQSKREEDAAILVFDKEPMFGRMSFMEANLPRHLQTLKFPKAGSYCHLFYPNGSHVWAIPEGGDIIRSHHPSVIFSDEAAYQPEFDKAYTAAIPAIGKSAQFIAVSSAEPGSFQQLVEAA